MPVRGYMVHNAGNIQAGNGAVIGIEAYLGRRRSQEDAQRAAVRMLARLLRWYPRQRYFSVSWDAPISKYSMRRLTASYDCSTDGQGMEIRDYSLSFFYTTYIGVTRRGVRRTALFGGTFSDLRRFGAVNWDNPVEIDVGERASYHEGRRALLRTLAQRLRSPFKQRYLVSFRYRTAGGLKGVITSYQDLYKPGGLVVGPVPWDNGRAFKVECSPAMITAAAKRSGTWSELVRQGAKIRKPHMVEERPKIFLGMDQ